MVHPPYTFTNINWQAGELKAVGYIKGKIAAQQTITLNEEEDSEEDWVPLN